MYKYKSLQAFQLQREHVFLANVITTKYLKQEVDDDLSVRVDEISPCGLSITDDFTSPNGEVPYGLLSRSCFYYLNLITVAPVTRDIEICQSHVTMR